MALTETQLQVLEKALFGAPGPGDSAAFFAVIDGASAPGLPQELDKYAMPHACLYAGRLPPLLEAKAPQLVKMGPGSAATTWLLREAWGQHWGIFLETPANLSIEQLQRHLRQYVQVLDEAGNFLYFRFYDPRVLSVYLPTCLAEELRLVFGPIRRFLCEQESDGSVLSFRIAKGKLALEPLTLINP